MWVFRVTKGLGLRILRLMTLLVGGALACVVLAGGLVAVGRASGGMGRIASFDVASVDDLKPLNIRSQVFDRYGTLIATWRGEQNRVPVPLSRVPSHLIQAVLDVEDSEFYRHRGVNVKGLARATAANVEAGGVAQGGSTITQQLVKLSILDSRQDLKRKVEEALLARRIEKKIGKDKILEQYLNTIYLGEGAYGVQAAAEQYFAKPVQDLTVVESAFLAGMIRNPVGYDPVRFRERSRDRRTVVLERMLILGHITESQFEEFKRTPMPRPADRLAKPETYFLEAVKQSLLDDPRLGKTKTDRYNSVFSGGLQIHTTFDPGAQSLAEKAIADKLPASAAPEFAMALVSLDVASGAVLAMVGGPGFATYKYNLATQGMRQPGSSWKPFTLIAALESGISPKSTVSGSEPCPIPNPRGKPDPYIPHNSSEGSGGNESILNQLVRSNNCAFARLAWIVGYDKVASVAKRLGITTKIDLVPAMALGVEEVRPIEMAGAYATIAAGGRLRKPFLVENVVDRNGKTVFKGGGDGHQVIPPEVARTVTAAMERVVTNGTGRAAQLDGRPAAGKTGTTNNYEDAWFVGFTPQIATAVWMGAPNRKLSMRNVGGIKVVGGTYPAQVWQDYMSAELASDPVLGFERPDPSLFLKGECLSVESVIQAQKDAERLAAQAVRDAEREAQKLRRETDRLRRAEEKVRKKADKDAARAAKAAKASKSSKSSKVQPSVVTAPIAVPSVVRGFGVGWSFQDGQAPVEPPPEPQAPAAEPAPVPEPAPTSVQSVDSSGSTGAKSAKSPKSTKSTVKKRVVSVKQSCSDEQLFTSLAGGSSSVSDSGNSGTTKKTSKSKGSAKSTKTTTKKSQAKTANSLDSQGANSVPAETGGVVPVSQSADAGNGPSVQPAEPGAQPAPPG